MLPIHEQVEKCGRWQKPKNCYFHSNLRVEKTVWQRTY